MRQERITKKPRRRTTRQQDATSQDVTQQPVDLTEADALLAHIEQLVGGA